MGLFSFLKNVGNKLRHNDDAPQADDLQKELASHNLGTENVHVSMAGDKAVLQGQVRDQAAFEKAVLAVGNVQGVSGVNTDGLSIAGAPAGEPVFYTVKSGDTLSKIAEEQYGKGNANKYDLIFQANQPLLTSPDKIYPGQVLRIPPLQ